MHRDNRSESQRADSQIRSTCLSVAIFGQDLHFELANRGNVDWHESVHLFLHNEGSRCADTSLSTVSFLLGGAGREVRESQLQDEVSDAEFLEYQRRDREVILFRGSGHEASSSLVYRAASILAASIKMAQESREPLPNNKREKLISEENILRKLQEARPDCPLSRAQSDYVEFSLVDDDCANMMFLSFARNEAGEVHVCLATAPYGEYGALGFMLRDPTIGGGALWQVRTAAICLGVALRAEGFPKRTL